ncbi:M48 family metallopeptidase [Arcicella rigui]|uniref:M48 family metallopeptidase n=1 Tax=Arcicella rigui TaxID=797020 RepID=A0ABU5Q8C6_9BACT|nr:M48 family metallopeptidase [Arcicella rigui]MEA5139085.1 M48 family metallopeptidase [Arcicella rigui]
MKKILFYGAILLSSIWACTQVPISGRNQLLLVSDDEMNAMSFTSYKQFLDTNKVVPANTQQAAMVKRVGDRIAKAAQSYFEKNNAPDYLKSYQWQTELVQSNQVNAWCMPGGKMVVYTGILPITVNETGLAVVMGHEVSHAIAKHGSERMSQGMVAQGLLTAGQVGLGIAMQNKPSATKNLWNTVFNVAAPTGAQLGMLAFGRNQESEADHLGLIFMAMAGYNPQEAVSFWGRMAAQSGGAKASGLMSFLSTHPSDEKRIEDIKRLMPEALQYYNTSSKK